MPDPKKGDIDLAPATEVKAGQSGTGGANLTRADASDASTRGRYVARALSESADVMQNSATRIGSQLIDGYAAVNKMLIDRQALLDEDRKKHEDASAESRVRQDSMDMASKLYEDELNRFGADAKGSTDRVNQTFDKVQQAAANIRFNDPDRYNRVNEFLQQQRANALLQIGSHERNQLQLATKQSFVNYVDSVIENAKKDPATADFNKAHLLDVVEDWKKDKYIDPSWADEYVRKSNEKIDHTAFTAGITSYIANRDVPGGEKFLSQWQGRISADILEYAHKQLVNEYEREMREQRREAREQRAEMERRATQNLMLAESSIKDRIADVALGRPVDERKLQQDITLARSSAAVLGKAHQQYVSENLVGRLEGVRQATYKIDELKNTKDPETGEYYAPSTIAVIAKAKADELSKNITGDVATDSKTKNEALVWYHAAEIARQQSGEMLNNPGSNYNTLYQGVVNQYKQSGKDLPDEDQLKGEAAFANFGYQRQHGYRTQGGVMERPLDNKDVAEWKTTMNTQPERFVKRLIAAQDAAPFIAKQLGIDSQYYTTAMVMNDVAGPEVAGMMFSAGKLGHDDLAKMVVARSGGNKSMEDVTKDIKELYAEVDKSEFMKNLYRNSPMIRSDTVNGLRTTMVFLKELEEVEGRKYLSSFESTKWIDGMVFSPYDKINTTTLENLTANPRLYGRYKMQLAGLIPSGQTDITKWFYDNVGQNTETGRAIANIIGLKSVIPAENGMHSITWAKATGLTGKDVQDVTEAPQTWSNFRNNAWARFESVLESNAKDIFLLREGNRIVPVYRGTAGPQRMMRGTDIFEANRILNEEYGNIPLSVTPFGRTGVTPMYTPSITAPENDF